MESFKPYLAKVATGASLTREEARSAFDDLLSGEVTPAQGGAFLMALRVRGEALDEIVGAVAAMRGRMTRVKAPEDAMDIVGTGGDHSGSYNISTLASIIVAACGVPVAKHGNRAASSKSGAADVLTALGVKIGLDPADLERCLAEAGLCFMFAQSHHASMRHVAPVRVELGTRTLFNLLGPLSNPAGVVAPAARRILGRLARAADGRFCRSSARSGSGRCMAPTVSTRSRRRDRRRSSRSRTAPSAASPITPEEVGIALAKPEDLKGGDPEHNAAELRAVLDGARTAYRDIGVLNAAASLVVAGTGGRPARGCGARGPRRRQRRRQGDARRLIAVSNAP